MNEEPYKDYIFPVNFDTTYEPTKQETAQDIRQAIKDDKKRSRESYKHRVELTRERYYNTPPELRPHKPKGPEYTIVQNYLGRNVRIKSKNKTNYRKRQETKRRQIINQPHNADMSTKPNKVLEGVFNEYTSTHATLPKTLRQQKLEVADVEPWWVQNKPQLRKSWPEFCRDFIGQNYGAIAQDLLQMHASDDPALRVQFMKFIMEMGKQGNPQAMQLDVNANVKSQANIYAELTAMAAMSSQAPASPLAEQDKLSEPQEYTEPDEYQYTPDTDETQYTEQLSNNV